MDGPALYAALTALVLLAVVAFVVTRRRAHGEKFTPGGPDLGERLARKKWRLYVMPGCGFCDKQLAILGGTYPRLTVCTGGKCAGVASAFPHWANEATGATAVGLRDGAELQRLAAE